MDMTGERRIAAPRQVVWEALNDTTILKSSIPGCESLEKTGDNQMKATAAVKLGPISARFNGAVTLSDIDAPNGYTITGEGQGGVAGFAKGGAKVSLTDDAGDTLLKYEVNAQVGGKLAQLGARLIDATAKQMAEQFFTKFSGEVQKLVPAPVAAVPVAPAATVQAATVQAAPVQVEVRPPPVAPPSAVSPLALIPREAFGLPVMGWIGIVVFVGVAVLWLASIF
jgi:carbon monoxide dehydrogenase subunit G